VGQAEREGGGCIGYGVEPHGAGPRASALALVALGIASSYAMLTLRHVRMQFLTEGGLLVA
jgi:hypothetical protein